MTSGEEKIKKSSLDVCVIGMVCRFPGAKNYNEFWENLKGGIESITFLSDEELKNAGVEHHLMEKDEYVKSYGGVLENKECFDHSFFNYSPKEAELLDPQIRIFHECAWEALEDAGYSVYNYKSSIGLYAGSSPSFIWQALCILSGKGLELGQFSLNQLANRDYLCSRVSYKLNLRGPTWTFNTTCSTSLVAVHQACRALLTGDCKIAMAGGVSVKALIQPGYIYQEGMIMSPDGHTRTFDAKAKGTNGGEGVGVVVLKMLKNALDDGDYIHAVIKGTAVNNDGYRKVGFTAPSVEGQSEVIQKALRMARIGFESITFVECHGSGTPLGDSVEVEALRRVFNTGKSKNKKSCALGAVKTNIGHLDAAAGVAGFIKVVLALKYKQIPPALHFENPNPRIDFENSPFYVNTELKEWCPGDNPLRAGVSSFGIGGTNAHVILEEAPSEGALQVKSQYTVPGDYQLILLSAQTPGDLDVVSKKLLNHLEQKIDTNLGDAAYTLQVGRTPFKYKRKFVCSSLDEAIKTLAAPTSRKTRGYTTILDNPPVIFVFPGLGAQYVNMGRELYEMYPEFQVEMDRCFDILNTCLGFSIKDILFPISRTPPLDGKRINRPDINQLVIFIFEYSLARLIKGWGIEPYAMMGYSFGEYVAACLADVFSLEDALKLVVARSQLICQTPRGVMLSVPIPVHKVKEFMTDDLSISIDNGQSCIVSGPPGAVREFANVMKENRYICTSLESSHAIHSELMDPILKEFERQVGQVKLNSPQIPYISNVTGNWITVQESTDPSYWASHLRATVRFADGIKLIMDSNAIFVEVGPGNALSAMIRGYFENNSKQKVVPLVPPAGKDIPGIRFLLEQFGNLWLYGKNINWDRFHKGKKRHRVPLPTYPFKRQRYWIDWDSVDIEGSTFLKHFPLINKNSNSQFFTKKNNEGSQAQEPSAESLEIHHHLQLSSEYAPPGTELDSQLTEIYGNFLGISQVGILDDFFELGMDSLKTINIGVEIYKKLNVKIDLAILMEFSNIKELSEYISQTQNTNPGEEATTSVDVDGNINYSNPSNTIYPVGDVLKESSNEEFSVANITDSIELPQTIFLTGSTGFLGAHLLKELLNKTGSRIYCLLRGDDSLEMFQRMKKIWQYYFDVELEEFYQKRLFIVSGDLTKSLMGIKRERYDELVENVDTVIHSAADVRHYGKYAELRETNVNGTQRVVDFCLSGKPKKMHHISTVGVTGAPSSRVCFKESDLYIGQNFEGLVYSKSKFEAELRVQEARKKGLKASIYRVGNLVGRYEDGVFQENIETNQIYNDIKALISLGQFPSNFGNYQIELSPVDLCTRALIKLIILKDTIGYTLHLMNPYLLPLEELIQFINKFGFEIEPVDFQDFYNHVYWEVTSKNFTRSLTGIFYNLRQESEIEDNEEPLVTFESTFTQQVLKKAGFSWLELDFDYISRMLKHTIEVKYLSLDNQKKFDKLNNPGGKMDKKMKELRNLLAERYYLESINSVLGWDEKICMPNGGANSRMRQRSLLRRLIHEKSTDPALGKLLDDLRPFTEELPYDSDEASLIRFVSRDYERAVRVPPSFVVLLSEHLSKSYRAWQEAKKENDFSKVQDYLEKSIQLSRQLADFFPGYEHIADPLIDIGDHGMTISILRPIFAQLRTQLLPLYKSIVSHSTIDNSCLKQFYPKDQQLNFGNDMLKQSGYDFNQGRNDEAGSGFTVPISASDVRIISRVKEEDLGIMLTNVLHEAGHALYQQNINKTFEGTPLFRGASDSMHESQALLWSTIVGRSRSFWGFFYPKLQKIFPDQLEAVPGDNFYCAINKVAPSLLRVGADELTYNLHVLMRFDLELSLLEGKLEVRDLPEAWNERLKADLGITPSDDREGVLQDIHWYFKIFGGAYQSYTVGSIISTQLFEEALKKHPEITSEIEDGNFEILLGWLRDNIYQYGSKYTTFELLERATGEQLNIEPYIYYLEKKYNQLLEFQS